MPPLPDTGPGRGLDGALAALLPALHLPTRTLPGAVTARQNNIVVTTSTVPAGYGAIASSPDPGTVVGITLGAVGGFVLVLYLVYVCMSFGAGPATGDTDASSAYAASVLTRRTRASRKHTHRHKKRTSRRHSTRATAIIVEAESPPRAERIVVEERTARRSVSRPPVPPAPPRVVVDSDDDDDEVVVIEDASPSRRRSGQQNRRRSSGSARRESGYRDIDPDEYAGGNRPMREVRRSRRD